MKKLKIPSTDIIKDLFHYKDGELFWKKTINGRAVKGNKAGCVDKNGYTIITINGKGYMAHRIIWKLIKGKDPKDQLDHIDGNPENNDITNIREVNTKGNAKNRKKIKTNTSGYNGITWDKYNNKWKASVTIDGKHKNLGRFIDIKEAIKAREKANNKYGFHKTHGKR